MKQLTTRKVALVAIFSALYYILSFLPGIRAIGAANVTINIEAFMASIFGLVLGPYLGALTAFMAALLAWILPPGTPSPASAVFLPAPMINALVVGFIYTKRWKIAFAILALAVGVFWLLPPTQPWDQHFYLGFWVMWDKILALALIGPAAMLIREMVKGQAKLAQNAGGAAKAERMDLTIILSVIAAVLILINAWKIASERNVIRFQYSFFGTTLDLRFGLKELILLTASYGHIWLVLGFGILTCAAMLQFRPDKRFVWSGLIFVFSCASAVIGGGFFIGLFLGVLGGIFGFSKRKIMPPRITSIHGVFEMLLYFLLAFIGNEADNALGVDIFAVPLVYEGVFGISSLELLRSLFTVAPFFYFGIRLFQAVITALIATPLLRNLRASGHLGAIESTQTTSA